MKIDKLTREQKEERYKKLMTRLQKTWGNPINEDFGGLNELSDIQLLEEIRKIKGQLNFEIIWVAVRVLIIIGVVLLVNFLFIK